MLNSHSTNALSTPPLPTSFTYPAKTFVVDSNLTVVFWDGAMASLTSISPESALGQPLSAVLAEEESEDSLLGVVRETCRGKTSTLRQVSLSFNDGSEALFLVNVTSVFDCESDFAGVSVEMLNITSFSQQRVEEAMKRFQ